MCLRTEDQAEAAQMPRLHSREAHKKLRTCCSPLFLTKAQELSCTRKSCCFKINHTRDNLVEVMTETTLSAKCLE